MREITLRVIGTPVAKGSAKAFYIKALNRTMVTQTNADKQKPWVSSISMDAIKANAGFIPSRGRIFIKEMKFLFPRPKCHFGSGKNANNLKPYAPIFHTNKPDIDKLERCVLDALTGIVWVDDSQVCVVSNKSKVWANEHPGVELTIMVEDKA